MKLVSFLGLLFSAFSVIGQVNNQDSLVCDNNLKFQYKSLIIPTILIGYGVAGFGSDKVQEINSEIMLRLDKTKGIVEEDRSYLQSDITQYLPIIASFSLDITGIKAKHNFIDRSVILGTAYLINGICVFPMKNFIRSERPNNSSYRSFPSGHTATAFMGAEFLYQEYKDQSVWYGISGYLIAIGAGYMRLSNNQHWFTDVAAGAGIGILSTKIAYWVHPFLKKKIFKNNNSFNGVAMPFFDGNSYGLGVVMLF